MIYVTAEQAQQIEEALEYLRLHSTGDPMEFANAKAPEALATIRAARAQERPATPNLEQAARQLLDCFEGGLIDLNAVTALREALDKPICQCGDKCFPIFSGNTEYCETCGWPTELAEQAEQEPVSIPLENSQEAAEAIEKMMAEYGYPSNAYNAARAGWRAARLFAPVEPVKQEPVAWMQKATIEWVKQPHNERNQTQVIVTGVKVFEGQAPLYTAPVRTKDLSDDEIKAIALPMIPDEGCESEEQANFQAIAVIRAVIAADREKNRV